MDVQGTYTIYFILGSHLNKMNEGTDLLYVIDKSKNEIEGKRKNFLLSHCCLMIICF